MKIESSLQQKQGLKLSPKILQSINIMQLNQLELTEHLTKKIEENIFLEEEQKENYEQDLYYNPLQKNFISTSDVIEKATQQEEKLFQNLIQQASFVYNKEELEYKICQYLISSINSHGFLNRDDYLLTIKELGHEKKVIEKVRRKIQLFSPLGICCFDIQEFLILQLKIKKKHPTLIEMIKKDYNHLMKKDYNHLMKKYNLSNQQLKDFFTILSFLEVYPNQNAFNHEETKYINPDVILTKENDEMIISINEELFPKIKVDDEIYNNFNSQKKNIENENYLNLQKDYQEAKNLILNLNYRKESLLKVVKVLLNEQKDFFYYGIQFIKPYTLEKLSQETDLSISTLSRLSHSKYIATPWGNFSFAIFFSSNVGDEKTSSVKIKEIIKEVLNEYDGEKKLSDQKVANLLEKKGYSVARRTVNKYRKQLNILSSIHR